MRKSNVSPFFFPFRFFSKSSIMLPVPNSQTRGSFASDFSTTVSSSVILLGVNKVYFTDTTLLLSTFIFVFFSMRAKGKLILQCETIFAVGKNSPLILPFFLWKQYLFSLFPANFMLLFFDCHA